MVPVARYPPLAGPGQLGWGLAVGSIPPRAGPRSAPQDCHVYQEPTSRFVTRQHEGLVTLPQVSSMLLPQELLGREVVALKAISVPADRCCSLPSRNYLQTSFQLITEFWFIDITVVVPINHNSIIKLKTETY